jgi:hypothetical protein
VLADFPPYRAGADAHGLERSDAATAAAIAVRDGVNPVWAYHRYLPMTDEYGVDHAYAYGAPGNASEYALRAQLVQVRQYQALFEGFAGGFGTWYSAAIMWKTAGPWPALRGALYDWYLATSGGQWGAALGTGGYTPGGSTPHLQLNPANLSMVVVNRGLAAWPGAWNVTVAAWQITSGCMAWTTTWVDAIPAAAGIPPTSVSPVMYLTQRAVVQWPPGVAPNSATLLYRMQLTQTDPATGYVTVLSSTDYWQSNVAPLDTVNYAQPLPQQYDDLAAVRAAGPGAAGWAPLAANATFLSAAQRQVAVLLTLPRPAPNATAGVPIAFAVRVSLRTDAPQPAGETRVLPVLQSRSYVHIVPGETLEVVVGPEWPAAAPPPATWWVAVDGWNVATQRLTIAPAGA